LVAIFLWLIFTKITIVREKDTDWILYKFPRGKKELPKRLLEIIALNKEYHMDIWEYANIWYNNAIYYKGDVNTTSDWIFVTNGANYYKCGTKYCIWETRTWIDRNKYPYRDKNSESLGINNLYLHCTFGPFSNVIKVLNEEHFVIYQQ